MMMMLMLMMMGAVVVVSLSLTVLYCHWNGPAIVKPSSCVNKCVLIKNRSTYVFGTKIIIVGIKFSTVHI